MVIQKQKIEQIRSSEELKVNPFGILYIEHNVDYSIIKLSKSSRELTWVFEVKSDISNIYIDDEKVLFQSNQKNIYVLDIKNGNVIETIETEGFLKFPFENGTLVYLPHKKGYTPAYIKNGKIIWQSNEFIDFKFYQKNNCLIGFFKFDNWDQGIKSIFAKYDLNSCEQIWHFNLESLKITHSSQMLKYGEFQMKINHFVGVVHGILWMDIDVIMNGSFLLGLDAETGKCVHLLDTAENQNEVNYVALVPNRLPGSTFTTYDDKRNILFGFAHDHFHWQVDLSEKSPKIKMWSVEDEMKKHHAFVSAFMNCGISDSHIFFPVGSIGSTPQVFALNRETLKVDWQYFLTEGGAYYTPTKVEVTETHLYILDNTGTLHIFEKIEDN